MLGAVGPPPSLPRRSSSSQGLGSPCKYGGINPLRLTHSESPCPPPCPPTRETTTPPGRPHCGASAAHSRARLQSAIPYFARTSHLCEVGEGATCRLGCRPGTTAVGSTNVALNAPLLARGVRPHGDIEPQPLGVDTPTNSPHPRAALSLLSEILPYTRPPPQPEKIDAVVSGWWLVVGWWFGGEGW